MHELGHLIQKRDQQWILPDDGGNKLLSQENTQRVVAVCGKQISRLNGRSLASKSKTAGGPSSEARSEIQHLNVAIAALHDVLGLNVAVNNPSLVDCRGPRV